MKFNLYGSFLALAVAGAFTASANAATIVVDGTVVSTLSQAVNLAQTAGDFPHTINIMTDTIVNDTQVYITQPMTINGNADGDNIKCDVLVDVAAIKTVPAAAAATGQMEKAYITVNTSGTVEIRDLNIHPNTDGVDETDVLGDRVDGIRLLKPATVDEVGTYLLTRVNVSGSDTNNAYIPLDSGADLYSAAAKKWSSGKSITLANAHTAHAVVQLANGPGLGSYSATLDHCHIGLGKSAAVNSPASGAGTRDFLGGVYGHCGADGIRVSGNNTNILGTRNDRVRVLRSTNISGGNAHCVEVDSNGRIGTMEYVDIAGINSANLLKLNDANGNDFSRISNLRFVRGMGKFSPGTNQALFLNNDSRLPNMSDCTFVGPAASNTPVQTAADFKGNLTVKDSIFTSDNFGRLGLENATGASYTFDFCALPNDGVAGESLTTSTSVIGGTTQAVTPVPTNTISVSPLYRLTLANYDWSDAQGAGDPNNGPGNGNVLRPTNTAYGTASSTGGPLNGGAGAPNAGIDTGIWMLM